MSDARPVAIVSGMIAGVPSLGGATWAALQYALGLERLGWDVFVVEQVDGAAGDPLATTRSAIYFRRVERAFGLEGRASLVRPSTGESVGVPYPALRAAARRARLLVNLSGLLTDPALLEGPRVRLYVDLDPAFTQLWHTVEGIDVRLDGHHAFATVGLAIGSPDCEIPDCGRSWIPILPPVVLDAWPAAPPRASGSWTTVSNWRGYGSIHHAGRFYGQKAHAFREMIELPRRTDERFEVALAIHPEEVDDLAALRRHGWRLVDPLPVAGDPDRFRAFVAASKAEIGIAKSGYVAARSGWFSDRSACYLASGRPVVAQDTGFSARLPTGEGLIAFETVDGAAAAVEAVRADYPRHARAARAWAEAWLDSDRVLGGLLEAVGVAA